MRAKTIDLQRILNKPSHSFRLVNRSIFLLFALLLSAFVSAQSLRLEGTVKDDDTKKKMDGASVTVTSGGSPVDQITTSVSGKFDFELPLGSVYDIRIERDGFIFKIIRFDLKNLSADDYKSGFDFKVDVTLFADIENFDLSIMEEPVGFIHYDPFSDALDYDIDAYEEMADKIRKELKRLEKAGKEDAKLQEQFDELVLEGDNAVLAKDYDEGIEKYNEALKIKDDTSVQEKIASAQAARDAAAAAAKLEADYAAAMDSGESSMKSSSWEDAIASFTKASGLKPNEALPKDKIKEAERRKAEDGNKAEYEALVSQGDDLFEEEDFAVAIEKYEGAARIMPTENYPKDQIRKARELLNARLEAAAEAEAIEKRYQQLVETGDKNRGSENYDSALRNFEEALEVKAGDDYATRQIGEIQKLIEDQALAQAEASQADAEAERLAKIQAEYQAFVDAANEKFAADDLTGAKADFQSALGVKPEERLPQAKIDKIDELLAERDRNASADAEKAKRDLAFEDKMKEANALFASESYEDAIASYEGALEIKPGEKLPQSRIDKINRILAEKEELAQAESNEEALRRAEQEALAEQRRLEEEEARRKAEEDRLARLDELNRQKEAAEAEARALAEAQEEETTFVTNVDASKEEEVEQFYRNARESELEAKDEKLKAKKAEYESYLSQQEQEARNTVRDNLDDIAQQKESLVSIQEKGLLEDEFNGMETQQFKKDLKRQAKKNDTEAERNRLANAEKVEVQKDAQRDVHQNDAYRQKKVEAMKDTKEQVQYQQDSYQKNGDAIIAANNYDVEQAKEKLVDINDRGEDVRQESIEAKQTEKKIYKEYTEDQTKSADDRRKDAYEDIQDDKQRLTELEDVGEQERGRKIEQVKFDKEQNQALQKEKDLEAEIRRESDLIERRDKRDGSEPMNLNMREGMEDLAEGVTETSYELLEGRMQVIERTVKIGNKIDVYKKVISKNSTFYFRNDLSISEIVWKTNTLKRIG